MTTPKPQAVGDPTDPDVDLHVPAQRQQSWRAQGPIVGVVAIGGAIGACARYGASLLWPASAGAFPWTTLWVNAVGCPSEGSHLVRCITPRPA